MVKPEVVLSSIRQAAGGAKTWLNNIAHPKRDIIFAPFMQQIKLPYATLSYGAPIVDITYKRNAQLGFIEIRELIASAQKLSEDKSYVVLSDVRQGIDVTPLGRKVVSDPAESPLHRGTAILLKNEMIVLAANFINSFSKLPYPMKAFTERKKATEWLLTLALDARNV